MAIPETEINTANLVDPAKRQIDNIIQNALSILQSRSAPPLAPAENKSYFTAFFAQLKQAFAMPSPADEIRKSMESLQTKLRSVQTIEELATLVAREFSNTPQCASIESICGIISTTLERKYPGMIGPEGYPETEGTALTTGPITYHQDYNADRIQYILSCIEESRKPVYYHNGDFAI